MNTFVKSAAFALALTFVGGAALAAEACCCCCKDGEKKMACCDKDKAAAPKPGETKPAQPEHQHQH